MSDSWISCGAREEKGIGEETSEGKQNMRRKNMRKMSGKEKCEGEGDTKLKET